MIHQSEGTWWYRLDGATYGPYLSREYAERVRAAHLICLRGDEVTTVNMLDEMRLRADMAKALSEFMAGMLGETVTPAVVHLAETRLNEEMTQIYRRSVFDINADRPFATERIGAPRFRLHVPKGSSNMQVIPANDGAVWVVLMAGIEPR